MGTVVNVSFVPVMYLMYLADRVNNDRKFDESQTT